MERRRRLINDVMARRNVFPALQRFKNVVDGFHQHRPFTDQLVTTPGARMMDRAGDRVDLTALLGGKTCRDQRSASDTRLDHQHAQG